MPQDTSIWKPPVLFHFKVEFQWTDNSRTSASFAEVDGLGHDLVFSGSSKTDDRFPGLPTEVKVEDVVLKRSLEPLDEKISHWVKDSFNFLNTGWIEPCRVIITLLDSESKIAACWICLHAIPVKWKLNPLNASESKIAIESITLKHTKLIRSR